MGGEEVAGPPAAQLPFLVWAALARSSMSDVDVVGYVCVAGAVDAPDPFAAAA